MHLTILFLDQCGDVCGYWAKTSFIWANKAVLLHFFHITYFAVVLKQRKRAAESSLLYIDVNMSCFTWLSFFFPSERIFSGLDMWIVYFMFAFIIVTSSFQCDRLGHKSKPFSQYHEAFWRFVSMLLSVFSTFFLPLFCHAMIVLLDSHLADKTFTWLPFH